MPESIAEKAARLRATKQVTQPPKPDFSQYADLIPEVEPVHKSAEVTELDRVIDAVDIVDAYVRWCGKMTPNVGAKRESVMVSCPIPGHADKNPSAFINIDKGTWFCAACQQGGDKFDIAAYHHGLPVPGYKSKELFPELRRRMGADLGVVTVTSPTGRQVALAPAEEPPAEEPLAPIIAVQFKPADDYEDGVANLRIDWQSILPADTFWHQYMVETSKFDLPEEYHFWLAHQCLGTAVSNLITLRENPDIMCNLFVCLLGPSGIGKSRATRMQSALLREALPYKFDDPSSTGTYMAPMPGSGEALLDTFSKPEFDPSDPKKVLAHHQVRGLVSFDEMSTLASKSSRTGSTLKPALIQLFDGGRIAQKSRTSGLIVVEDPFCQVVSTTQPRSLRQVMTASDADSGFINRWVFAAGPPKRLDAYRLDGFDPAPLVEPLRRIWGWANMRARRFELTGDALDIWRKFFHAELEPMKQASDDLPLLTRADLTLRKDMIALAANELDHNIQPHHVEAVIEVIWPYLQASYGLISGQIGVGEVDACADALIEAIKKHEAAHPKPPTIRDLHGRYLKRRFNSDVILKALRNMVSLGQVKELEPPAGAKGQPAFRYSVPL